MITEATQTDIPALADMLRDLNACHLPHAPHRLHGDGDPAALEGFFNEAMERGARVLVYRTEGVARGYLMWLVQDRPGDAVTRPLRRALLDHVWVEPVWRRRGLAARLIARFEQDSRAAGCTGWIAHVFAVNAGSQALMRGQGAGCVTETFEKRYRR
ncbi:GNAT family N-acetyltransferase [Thetidibacter halocola]|uniref:GNAT family N-acetyltransferase n=1 Tax=Thetidibacter halocola TaxID=2827239 RepID=A0A8J7WCM1_9RHOB|nr:GNAT family N-acetyltransferase [Thetidibacter halocola]MBS0125107.1 GNAT family N-acetyltransferase [Thetidibacter halocola]